MLFACLLATLAPLPQDPPAEPTLAERIDALIEKTNAYEGFAARYRCRLKQDAEGEVRLLFRGPDQARFTFDGGGTRKDIYLFADRFVMRSRDENQPLRTATVTNPREEVECLALVRNGLEEAFPKSMEHAQAPVAEHTVFCFDIDPECSSLGFSLGCDGPARFTWLVQLRAQLSNLSWSEGEHPAIAFSPCAGERLLVSAESGFITRVECQAKDGVRIDLELIEFDSDAPPEAKEFEPGSPGEGAQDDSEAAEADFARRGLQRGRASVFYSVARMLDGGRLEWNEQAAGQVEEILHELAARELETMLRPLAQKPHDWIETMEQWLAAALAQPGGQEPEQLPTLREQVAQSREQFQTNLSKTVENLFGPEYPRDKCKSRAAFPDELRAIEERVLSKVYAEVVTQPLLAAFDEQVGKQLEAK